MSRTIFTPERLHLDIRCEIHLLSPTRREKADLVAPIELCLGDQIKTAQTADKFCKETIALLNKEAQISSSISLAHCTIQDGLLTYQDKVWIPEEIRTKVVQEVYTSL